MSRVVILFKSESDSDDVYSEELLNNGFQPYFVPTLSFGFKNLEELHAKLLNPDKYAGIIFTSPRCVEAVAEAMQGKDLPGGWKMLHNYSVGEVTHNLATTTLDGLFTHGKQTGNARNLADFIVDTFDGSTDLPFLLPCGNLKLETLPLKLQDAGYVVDACEVYETKCNPQLAERMDQIFEELIVVEFMAFFSPSGVNCACEYFTKKDMSVDGFKLIAIGPSTRRAIEQKGLEVYRTAEKPSVEYLIKVLVNPSE